jgi:two-component system nitrate/nitrite response regulator NarL
MKDEANNLDFVRPWAEIGRDRSVPVAESDVVTVVVGCFDSLVRPGLTGALSEGRCIRILARDVQSAALESIVVTRAPQVVVVNETVAGSVLECLRGIAPRTGVLVLAHDPSREFGMGVLATGATCLARNVSAADLVATVRRVAWGDRMFIAADGVRVERCYPSDAPTLTGREIDVLRCLSKGKSHAETACHLHIGVRTVHTYTARLCHKLSVKGKQELIGMPLPTDSTRDG